MTSSTTHDRAPASYPAPGLCASQYFFIHWRNSRLSCILHLAGKVNRRSGWDRAR